MLKDAGFTNVHSIGGLRTGQIEHIKDVCKCLSPDAPFVAPHHLDHAGAADVTTSNAYTCAAGLGVMAAVALLQ
jgi:hypothetical protein